MKYECGFISYKDNLIIHPYAKIKNISNKSYITIEVFNGDMTAFRKLQGLWYLLLTELEKQTGYSQLYWKKVLKTKSEYFISVKEPNGTVTREYKSVSITESSFNDLSKLFSNSLIYLVENEIIELNEFMNKYNEITGKEILKNY